MRRLVVSLLAAVLLAVPFAPSASAVPEAGTIEFTGVLTYSRSDGASHMGVYPAPCVHSRTPNSADVTELGNAAGWTCNGAFWLGGSAPTQGTFTLTGYFETSFRHYTMEFTMPDLFTAVGPNVATGTVSEGGRTGPATFTYVGTPSADPGESGIIGTLQYAIS